MEVFKGINQEKLEEILTKIKDTKVAIIGDICLDVYWQADMTKSELSRETPHFPLPVVKEWMSPGAGGNVAANIASLNPKKIIALGIIGKDWRGDALLKKLKDAGVNTDSIIISDKVVTNAYCKPIRKGISDLVYEDPRIDFINYESLPKQEEERLLDFLEQCLGDIDVLCVSDQLVHGCITPKVREKIICLAQEGMRVVVDSRDRIGLYKGVILKPNEVEGLRAAYQNKLFVKEDNQQYSSEGGKAIFEEYVKAAEVLAKHNNSKVCMTLGPKGCLYTDSQTSVHIPSYDVRAPIDICGAGDTFLSAFSCAFATGVKEFEAASFANMAADVTIKKIGTTGTASPGEIRERHQKILHIC